MTKTILIVDDSIFDSEFLQRGLKACDLSNPVTHVLDGEEAIELLSKDTEVQDRIGLILLDLKMPKVDGFEVLKFIKTTPRLEDIPVIVVSSSYLDSDRIRAKLLGATNYLAKPMELDDLATLLSLKINPFRTLLSS
jgi:two-component system response regulator